MIIKRTSILTGKENAMELPVTSEQIYAWKNGQLIQNAMPHLTVVQREFLISGMMPEEQNEIFNQLDEDNFHSDDPGL